MAASLLPVAGPLLALALLAAGTHAAIVEKMGIWMPLYADASTDSDFQALVKLVERDQCIKDSFHGTVLTGPRSGPPNVKDKGEDTLFRQRFSLIANTNQWTAFGYVTTGYGKRTLSAVLADIDTWLLAGLDGYGDYVQGLWVDQTVDKFDASNKAYYQQIVEKIKSYGKLAALNPGTKINDCAWVSGLGVGKHDTRAASGWMASGLQPVLSNVGCAEE